MSGLGGLRARCRLAFALFDHRHVVTDRAAGRGAQQGVVMSHVPGHPAHDGAGYAAHRVGGAGRASDRKGEAGG
jgi:hypothetical protein